MQTVSTPISTSSSAVHPGRKYVVWGAALLFVFFQFFLQLSSGEIIAGLMKSFSLTAFGGGVLASAYYYIYVSLQTPAGILMDRFGARRLLTVGAAVVTLGCWMFASAAHVWVAFIGRLLMGGGASFAFVGSLFLVGRWFSLRHFGLMASIAEAVGMLGSLIGGYYLAEMVQVLGWRSCMLWAAGLAVIIMVLVGLLVRDSRPDACSVQTIAGSGHLMTDLKSLLQNQYAWVNAIYSGLMFCIVTAFVALWGVPFLEYSHHISLSLSALICNMVFLGVAVGSPIIGWLDSRIRHRRIMLMGMALLSAVFISLVIYVPTLSLVSLAIIMFVLGLLCSVYVITFVIANEIATPHTRAASLGFTNTFSVGAAPLVQPLIGLLLYLQNPHLMPGAKIHYTLAEYQWALLVLPVLMLVAAWLARYMPERP